MVVDGAEALRRYARSRTPAQAWGDAVEMAKGLGVSALEAAVVEGGKIADEDGYDLGRTFDRWAGDAIEGVGESARRAYDTNVQARRTGSREDWKLATLAAAGLGVTAADTLTGGGKTKAAKAVVSEAQAVRRKADALLAPPGYKPGQPLPSAPAVKRNAPGFDRAEMATRYPKTAAPELVRDPKTGKEYLGKVQSEEALAVDKVRKEAQADIKAGRYDPYFKVEDRFHVDPANYPLTGNTLIDTLPKKQVTTDKWRGIIDTPEARGRLRAAFDNAKDDPKAWDWYAMGQLEGEFVRQLGPEEGRRMFRERFGDAMAATTGGADPTSNLLMAGYGNFQRAAGQPLAEAAYDLPYPIGGRYASGNISMYDRLINGGKGLVAADNPKRHNFSGNFQGHLDRPTIDEQMTGLIQPGKGQPDNYSVAEGLVTDEAGRLGIDPVALQEVAWAGAKKGRTPGYSGTPMIQTVNEAIERTRRVTGLDPSEVVRRMVRAGIPYYAIPAAIALPMTAQMQQAQPPPEEEPTYY